MSRKKIKIATIKRLYSHSGNECAFPNCKEKFFGNDNTNLSNIGHIEGAEPNSARYNPTSNDEYRRSYENLILLCPNHHKIVDDNPQTYPVENLRVMKNEHEEDIKSKIDTSRTLNKHPSAIVEVIKLISAQELNQSDDSISIFKPEEKIEYNEINKYKDIIDEFYPFQGRVNEVYNQIEAQGFKKEIALTRIKTLYFEAKNNILSNNHSIVNIKNNADALIDEVKKSLWNLWETSHNADSELSIEAIEVSLNIIIVDAFMRCKILEAPVIISPDTHPERDLYFIGSLLIEVLDKADTNKVEFFEALELINANRNNNKVSINLFILSINWLFLLDIIQFEEGCIKKCF